MWKRGEVLSCRIILQVSKHRLQQRSRQLSFCYSLSEELEFHSRSVIKTVKIIFAVSGPEDYLQRLKHENLPVSFNQNVR